MNSCRNEETNKKISLRLKKIEGQIRGLINMVADNRDCLEIMNQIQSASSALKGVWEIIAASHLENCLTDEKNIQKRNQTIEEIVKSIKELR